MNPWSVWPPPLKRSLRTTITWRALLVSSGLLWACRRDTPLLQRDEKATAASQAHAQPEEELTHLDARTPVPLLPVMADHQKRNMRDHLIAVQEIIVGLANSDFASIEEAAARIGFSEQMGQMCSHMGAGAPGFTEQALRFHHTADAIADAARERESPARSVQRYRRAPAATPLTDSR
jgi:hypothetical protein